MKIIKLAAILLALWSISFGCKTDKILTADFERDALNAPPAKNLPNAPDGDEITYHDAIQPRLRVVSSTLSGSKALQYSDNFIENPPPLASQWLGFKGIETSLTQTLWFIYTGQIHGKGVTVDISDGDLQVMGRLIISDSGEVSVVHSFDPNATHHNMGNVGQGPHTVVFTVFTSQLKYNVTIVRESGPALVAENQPMLTTDLLQFKNPARPKISFLLLPPNGSTSFYEIGSVNITKKKP